MNSSEPAALPRRIRWRRWLAHNVAAVSKALGRNAMVVLGLAALSVAVMYCSNNNLDKHPELPRGDGQYRPVMARGDGHMHFLFTRSLLFDRDVQLDNDLAQFGDPWQQPRTVTGRKNVMQQVGPSLIWAPVLAGAHGAALVANLFGANIQTHGYTLFHQRILFATSVLFAWLAVALALFVVMRLGGGRWSATWAAIAVLLGTTLTYYATYMPSYAHAMDAAATAGFLALWALTYSDTRWRRAVWLGVMLGICLTVRVQNILLGSVLAIELALGLVQHLRSAGRTNTLRFAGNSVGRGALALMIALVIFSPQLYVWKVFYGAWITTPQGPGMVRYGHPMILELLFSARNGWLATHPIAYFGVIGLGLGVVLGPRIGPRVRVISAAMLVAVATQVYANAATMDWWGSSSFGQRRMCSATLPLVLGLAWLLTVGNQLARRLPRAVRHGMAITFLTFFVAWNLNWVGQLRHGATAGRDEQLPCCHDVPKPLAMIAAPVYRVVGNPFAWPASALFAWRHDVPLTRWDQVVGHYPLVPAFLGYVDGSYKFATGTWHLTDGNANRYLLQGWGPAWRPPAKPAAPGHAQPNVPHWRWTTAASASALLPILLPEPHRITVPMFANAPADAPLAVVVRCNGAIVATAKVGPAWTNVTFDTDGSLGENVITIEAPVAAPQAPPSDAPPALDTPVAIDSTTPIGVAMRPWHVALPH